MNNTEDVEPIHYHRTCLSCGANWWGLHCPHDGYQNPCPNCKQRPATVPTRDDTCEFVLTQQEANQQKRELLDDMLKAFTTGKMDTPDDFRQIIGDFRKKLEEQV